ncbi:MAG TPA: NUDIX hydrolase [Vicinamibacterales bacterium]|jgi:ADP-ribose pyrophosphatase|nr:NUDIX hydrolase [Vicinamibacterales bacterium]
MTLRRKTIYRGRVFRIEQDRVTLPHGPTVIMDVVRHRGSVVLIPEPSPGKVILIRQYRHAIGRWIWEWPAGSLEPGEAPARAARRECEEEIGLRPKRIQPLGMFYPTPGFCDEHMVFYHCTDLVRPRRPADGDPDEQIEPVVYRRRDVWRLIERGDIVDMKTLVGLVLLERGGVDKASARRAPSKRQLHDPA